LKMTNRNRSKFSSRQIDIGLHRHAWTNEAA
jgi:hypothetical protein